MILLLQGSNDLVNAVTATETAQRLFQAVQILVGKVLDIDKLALRALGRAHELIDLHLQHAKIAVLGVLNDKHHQKRNNRRNAVDDQLPALGEPERRT